MTSETQGLIDALARKNTIEPPRVSPIDLQVRTAIGFKMKQDDEGARLLVDRPGASRLQVVWQYSVPRRSWNDFTVALREAEGVLFARKGSDTLRYLGTYVIQEKPEDERVFVTSWACSSVEDAKGPASPSWSGLQDSSAKSAYHAVFRFVDLKAATITTRGLAASIEG